MRLSLVLLIVAGVGFAVGGWLVGTWMVGVAVMVESAMVAAYALIRDIPPPRPSIQGLPDVLERFRDSA